MSIKILKPGLFTTIQDEGRIGHQSIGFSNAGALDYYSFKIGKALIENDGPTIEFTIIGPTIEFQYDNAFLITGGEFNSKLNNEPISHLTIIKANKGDVLELGNAIKGVRGYLFFVNPLNLSKVADSYSTHTRSGIGGLDGRTLKVGDIIPTFNDKLTKENIGKTFDIDLLPNDNIIHIIEGPQIKAFSNQSIQQIVDKEYKISDQSDRMGYRLVGEAIPPINSSDIISEPVALGSIQVPKDGNPIILLNDKQTVGGYTKIATVTQLDVSKLSQFKPGETIQFKWISIEEATENLIKFNKELDETIKSEKNNPLFNLSGLRNTSQKISKIIKGEN